MIAHAFVRHFAKSSRFFAVFGCVHPAKNIIENIPNKMIFFILLYIRGKNYITMVIFCLELSTKTIMSFFITYFIIFYRLAGWTFLFFFQAKKETKFTCRRQETPPRNYMRGKLSIILFPSILFIHGLSPTRHATTGNYRATHA